MSLSIVIPSWSTDRVNATVDNLRSHAAGQAHRYVAVLPISEPVPDSKVGKVTTVWTKERRGAVEAMGSGAGPVWLSDLIMFLHDDAGVLDESEPWDAHVFRHFEDHPRCGLAGWGGAVGLGRDDIYKTPYDLNQLARIDYQSNMRDWATHGSRATLPLRVAVLDGFCQIFRGDAYRQMGGWQRAVQIGISFHMYDAYAACMMARMKWETGLIPTYCHHDGGGTSVKGGYEDWLKSKGVEGGDTEIHRKAHEIIFSRFRDVLPLRV